MLLPRSVSCRRFGVSGKRPDPLAPEFLEALRKHRFTGLTASSPETEATGWVSFGNFLDTEVNVEEMMLGRYLRLGLRIDKRVVPASLVKAHVELEKKALRAAGESKLSKRELDEIKEGVIDLLRPQTPPKIQFIRGIWSIRDKTLFLLTVSESAAELFSQHFQKTFENKLASLEPVTMLRHLGLSSDLLGKLEVLDPADFRPVGVGGGR